MRKYQKYKKINKKDCRLIDYGSESQIYLYQGKVLKDFTTGRGWNKSRKETLINKKNKLELLQNLHHPNHPEIYNFYLLKNKIIRAYSMDYFEDNIIENVVYGSFEEKIWLINKIWQNVKEENKEDIYNFDIAWWNFCLDKDGNLYTIDIDNLKVGKYSNDMESCSLRKFINNLNFGPTNIMLQNFSMLINILIIFLNDKVHSFELYEIKKCIIRIIKDEKLQTLMLNIVDGKEEDMEEVLALTKNLKLNN